MGMGLRIVDLLPALPEPNQRWLVLLGPRSVDLRAFSMSVVNSFSGNFVWLYIFAHASISS